MVYAECMKVTGTPEINLLPTDEIEKAPLGKFLKWALTYGRYIVVITELIVLLAFLSRFKLDRDITDLSEEIMRKKNIIVNAEPFENKVRQLQNRLEKISLAVDATNHPDRMFSYLTTILPQETVLDSVTISGSQAILTGKTPSETGLSTLVSNLRKNKDVTSIAVDKIVRDEGGVVSFSLTLNLWL